jgi:LCP family protein required for cell wall assembly
VARRTHSPFVAAVLSGILPGWGQWYVGYRRRGLVLLAISAFAAVPIAGAVIILYLGDGPSIALDLVRPFFDHPDYLFILLAANVAVLAFRLIAALDAFWLAGGGFSRRWSIAVAMSIVVLGVVVAAPHGWTAQRNLALHDLLSFDYSVDPDQATAAPTTTTSTSSTTVASTEPPTSVTTSTTSTSTTTTTTLPPIEQRRLNVLLLGGDAGPDRTGIRTDTMILVSIDPATGSAAMLQLPRNHVDLPIPEGHPAYDVWECHCYPRLANTIYQYGLEHPELFPGGSNSGARAVMDLTSHLYGIDIHRYALVDLLGFVDVIDALGGLTVTVTSGVYDEQYTRPGGEVVPVEYHPGTYQMDGEEVLAFARVRRNADDYARMGRQRCVLQALASQASPVGLLRGLPYLVPAIQDSIVTDIPVRDWPDYITLAGTIDSASIVSVRFMPNAPELVGTGTAYVIKNPEGYWIPNAELIRQTVRTVLTAPPAEASESLGIDPLAEICGTG